MILVDSEIRQLGDSVIVGFDEKNVGPISYDVSIDTIIANPKNVETYALQPGETVYIKTIEKIKVPEDMMIRVGQKNSKMRMLLSVDGPNYFPGHETFMYLRVHNMSSDIIQLDKDDSIAQIFFERLSKAPDIPYNKKKKASFNDEDEFRGYGNYKEEYERKIKKVNEAREKLDDTVSSIYTNIMTIMGVFVSIFSLIMVNFTNINVNVNNSIDPKALVTINISLGIIIALFIGLILIFINKAKNKKFLLAYILVMTVLLVILAALLC